MENTKATPFFVWIGGKRKLLKQISDHYPQELIQGKIKNYIEPFVGGGAVFFDIMQKYNIENSILIDINPNIINAYKQVKENPERLVNELKTIENRYNNLPNMEIKGLFYYAIRKTFNIKKQSKVLQAAHFIFLCKTFFNGVYRVNKKSELNTPFGQKVKIKLFSEENIYNCSNLLKNTNLICGDYKECEWYVTDHTFLYFDSPYRPTEKSGYIKYSADPFTDIDQIELSDLFDRVTEKNALAMLSNSSTEDGFFEKIYNEYSFHQLDVHRCVSGDIKYRKAVSELLITNFTKR